MNPVSIGELCRVFNPGPGLKVLALLSAYLDASMKGKLPLVTAVAGYVAPLAEWERVEAEWRKELAFWRIEEFGLADLPLKAGIGMERAELCGKAFQRIIEGSKLDAIGAAVLDADWERPDWRRDTSKRLSSPYEQCLDLAFGAVGEHTNIHFPSERVGIVCCLDAPERRIEAVYASNAQKYPQFVSISASASKDVRPLECADLGVGRLRESWRQIAAGGAEELPWGAMPRGKGTEMPIKFWSLRQGGVLTRALRVGLSLG